MPEYRVTWEIDLTADSPYEAAQQALAIHRKPDSIATVFEVHGEGRSVTIDLEDVYNDTGEGDL